MQIHCWFLAVLCCACVCVMAWTRLYTDFPELDFFDKHAIHLQVKPPKPSSQHVANFICFASCKWLVESLPCLEHSRCSTLCFNANTLTHFNDNKIQWTNSKPSDLSCKLISGSSREYSINASDQVNQASFNWLDSYYNKCTSIKCCMCNKIMLQWCLVFWSNDMCSMYSCQYEITVMDNVIKHSSGHHVINQTLKWKEMKIRVRQSF